MSTKCEQTRTMGSAAEIMCGGELKLYVIRQAS